MYQHYIKIYDFIVTYDILPYWYHNITVLLYYLLSYYCIKGFNISVVGIQIALIKTWLN